MLWVLRGGGLLVKIHQLYPNTCCRQSLPRAPAVSCTGTLLTSFQGKDCAGSENLKRFSSHLCLEREFLFRLFSLHLKESSQFPKYRRGNEGNFSAYIFPGHDIHVAEKNKSECYWLEFIINCEFLCTKFLLKWRNFQEPTSWKKSLFLTFNGKIPAVEARAVACSCSLHAHLFHHI